MTKESEDCTFGERIQRAKQMARPQLTLEQWSRRGWARTLALDPSDFEDSVPRVDARALTPEIFEETLAGQPVVLTNLTESWQANQSWTPELLSKAPGQWRVGCNDGTAVTVTLADFFQYCAGEAGAAEDDSPLYVFDWDFAEAPERANLLTEYEVPGVFGEDLFEYLDHLNSRPPHQWIIIGPARSGSTLHTDPLHTSAWNALLHGTKRWAIFPPECRPEEVLPDDLLPDHKELGGAAQWFHNVLPRAKQSASWGTSRPLELLQVWLTYSICFS